MYSDMRGYIFRYMRLSPAIFIPILTVTHFDIRGYGFRYPALNILYYQSHLLAISMLIFRYALGTRLLFHRPEKGYVNYKMKTVIPSTFK